MKELILKKCVKCGALVKVINDCQCGNCGIICCGDDMQELKANSTDAAFEKHVPTYEIKGDKIIVKVNHVMDSDHYIEWICMKTNDLEEYHYFNPGDEAIVEFNKVDNAILNSYCNKHGLWKSEVK